MATCRFCGREIAQAHQVPVWATDPGDFSTRWCDDREDGVPRRHRPEAFQWIPVGNRT